MMTRPRTILYYDDDCSTTGAKEEEKTLNNNYCPAGRPPPYDVHAAAASSLSIYRELPCAQTNDAFGASKAPTCYHVKYRQHNSDRMIIL